MDVNEVIVNTWLNEVKKFFTIPCIDYGQFHQDIDILAVNMNIEEVWDCEIKVRTGSTKISNNNNKQNGFLHFVNTMNDTNRNTKCEEFIDINNNLKFKKKFITTKSLLGAESNQQRWINKFNENNIDVIFFDEIVDDLSNHARVINKSNNEILQMLRLFFIHQEINE